MAVREFRNIKFEESELKSMQLMLSSGAGQLMDRILLSVARAYEEILHDPTSSLERLRFSQGALEYGGLVNDTIQAFLGYQIGEEVEDEEDSGGEEAAVPDVNF